MRSGLNLTVIFLVMFCTEQFGAAQSPFTQTQSTQIPVFGANSLLFSEDIPHRQSPSSHTQVVCHCTGCKFAGDNCAGSNCDGSQCDLYHCDADPMHCDGISEVELEKYKKQFLQSVSISGGWIAGTGAEEFDNSFLEFSIGGGIPLGSFDDIVGIRPRFRIDWIDAASTIDIPDELYQFSLDMLYRRSINDELSALFIVSPSIRSDLTTSDDAFRVFALGVLNWECIPDQLVLSGGVVYLGRADLPVLPAVGLSWTPNRQTSLDLRFPTSKLAYRLTKDGGRSEVWTYLSGGLGGNTWSVTRNTSATDELSLRDIRVTLGIEKRLNGGGGWFAETGYAFNRRLEYESDDSEVDLGDGFVLQAGWRY